MSGRGIQPEEAIGVSFIPHLHPIGIDRCHVLDLVLDQTGSHSGQNYAGSYFATYPGYKQRCSIGEQKLTDDNGKPLRSTVEQLRLIWLDFAYSHTKYTVTKIFATSIVRQSHRRVDVLLYTLRV